MKEFKGERIRTKEENSLYQEKHLLKYFKNEEDAKFYSRGSERYIDCKCPICGFEKKIRAHNLYNNGFSCKYCKDTMSYPERFIYSYLKEKGINFKYQYKLKGHRRYFDFYLLDEDIAIEANGEQHYNKNYTSNWENSYEKTLESDKIKREYCKVNNITLVELNCSKSSFQFIKRQIENSILPSITKEEEKKIKTRIINKNSKKVFDIVEDVKKGIPMYRISKIHGVDNGTVHNIVDRLNLREKYIKDGRIKTVYCNETGEVFKSTAEAERQLGLRKGSVGRVASGERKSCGDKKGNRFTFKYI